jgi:hypothetical protein
LRDPNKIGGYWRVFRSVVTAYRALISLSVARDGLSRGVTAHGLPDIGVGVAASDWRGAGRPEGCGRPPGFALGMGSGREQADLDADGGGEAGEVAGVAGYDGGLVADGGGDDDGIDDVGGAGCRAG